MVVGLAPAAHGGNRTGRVFTGDRSGDFLFSVLHQIGFANQPTATSADDGLLLTDLYICAVNRCAPPGNQPTPDERDNCLPYLVRELRALDCARVIVCLGAYAWDGVLRALGQRIEAQVRSWRRGGDRPLHVARQLPPIQQNTFTGRLTRPMLVDVFRRSRELIGTG